MARNRQIATWDGRKIALSNLDKVLFPAANFIKAEVIDYYVKVAPYLLPHLNQRPVTMKRYPDGVSGKPFYEKDAPNYTPSWVETFPVPRRKGGPEIRYILINDLPTLVWCANLANLEIHPFLHRAPHIQHPTAIVFDLDPGEGAGILDCAQIAFLLKERFDRMRLESLPKVSGSKGLQLYIPLNTPVTYAATQPFARQMAEELEAAHPGLAIAKMTKAARHGKVFIDWSQNSDFKTTVAVYSLRAKRPQPYVSMPVTWDELAAARKAGKPARLDFAPDAALKRLEKQGDLFAPVLELQQKLPSTGARTSAAI
jgi:bifunctional non-homologous end joining protein LigD